MKRKDAVALLKKTVRCETVLIQSPRGQYSCPLCQSGFGSNGTGAVQVNEDNSWWCHACNNDQLRGKPGDVIDAYMYTHEVSFNDALLALAEEQQIEVDPYKPPTAAEVFSTQEDTGQPDSGENANGGMNPSAENIASQNAAERGIADYTDYYRACQQRIDAPEAVAYLEERGISLDTARKCGIGYDPAADPANVPGAMGNEYRPHPCKRIIFPCRPDYYATRAIEETSVPKANPSRKHGAGSPGIFNAEVLNEEVDHIFVVEGAFDGLSIMGAGYPAVSLNSAGGWKRLLDEVKERLKRRLIYGDFETTLLLCPDDDPDPQTAARTKKHFSNLAAGLKEMGVDCVTVNVNCGKKDANEALVANRETFETALAEAIQRTTHKPDNVRDYMLSLWRKDVESFHTDIMTGYSVLDRKTGGLYPGLYILAAISSLGKTTFVQQMADQLATQGNHVLFFSLEMSRFEMVSKSIARRTVLRTKTGEPDVSSAVTSLKIRKGTDTPVIQQAIQDFINEVGDRFSVIEGSFGFTVADIRQTCERYIMANGVKPVVFVDYLQVIPPPIGSRLSGAKEITDTNIVALKQMSRDLGLTLFVISSVNRTNYLTPIDFESLKESGAIEYTADVVFGLQLAVIDSVVFQKAKDISEKRKLVDLAKKQLPRDVSLRCLKNRFGSIDVLVELQYYSAYDLFRELPLL